MYYLFKLNPAIFLEIKTKSVSSHINAAMAMTMSRSNSFSDDKFFHTIKYVFFFIGVLNNSYSELITKVG